MQILGKTIRYYPSSFQPYVHFFWLSILLAFLLVTLYVSVASYPNYAFFLSLGVYLIVGFTVTQAAIWSVLDGNNFFCRLLVAVLCLLIVLVGICLGFVIFVGRIQPSRLAVVAETLFLSLFPILLISQLPFWVMRLVWGWQLLQKSKSPVPASIRQIMLITFTYAIAFASPLLEGLSKLSV